ncbi:MAG: type II toxin-antitoxin system YafQ family toxin [Mangrovibacterium sp.]|nr:type II toxin-antitoxin system YafQ family toxin [Mangrovibacterium sp.]
MYVVKVTNRFKKDVERCRRRNLDLSKLETIVDILKETGGLPVQYKPHKLKGKYAGLWECHIEPDWLMTWEQNDRQLIILLMQTGTHSDLF